MMSRIVLVIPPGLPGTTSNHEGSSGLGAVEAADGFRYPPHTAAVVAAVLRDAGYEVTVIDAAPLGYDTGRCVQTTLEARPELVGAFVSWATREADGLFISALRQGAGLAVPLVALGVSASLMCEALGEADYLLEGEPELAFRALCDRLLRESEALDRVVSPATLHVPDYDPQGLLSDLNALPFPAWDLLPLERYPFLSVLSSRGCEEHCRWCPYVVAQGQRFRACSPERVVAELREVVRLYHPRRVVFRDPAFAQQRGRVEAICRGILADRTLKPGKNLLWECESYPEHLDGALLSQMRRAGCGGIKIGLETTDAGVLYREERVREESDVAGYLSRVAALTRDCARLGIACRLFVLVGLPGQTLDSARETAAFVRALSVASLTVKVFKPYPGLRTSRQVSIHYNRSEDRNLSAAKAPREEEIRAQAEVLEGVAQAIRERPKRQSPRWRRALKRLLNMGGL
jgi:radical SAM superfamily enzyme YgiQ (UPF0313 family)